MNYTELEDPIGGSKYRIGVMDAMTQFHVSRRLAPLIASYGVSLSQIVGTLGKKKISDEQHQNVFGPVVEIMAAMKDADCEFIIFSCLRVTQRQVGESWAAVSLGPGKLMFEDLDLQGMIRLVVEVVKSNLGPFILELLGGLTPAPSSEAPAPAA